jgi:hypothetical protein
MCTLNRAIYEGVPIETWDYIQSPKLKGKKIIFK